MASLERRVAVLAGRLAGGFIVGVLDEVEPSPTSGLATSAVAACQGSRHVCEKSGRSRSGRSRSGKSGRSGKSRRKRAVDPEVRRRTLWSSVAEAGGGGGGALGVCRLHHWEFSRDRWQGEVQKGVRRSYMKKRGSSERKQSQKNLRYKDQRVIRRMKEATRPETLHARTTCSHARATYSEGWMDGIGSEVARSPDHCTAGIGRIRGKRMQSETRRSRRQASHAA
jgi:hypothetical protein